VASTSQAASLPSALPCPPPHFQNGDDVYGLGSTVPTHSNAEYVTADWRVLARKPVRAGWEDAAALPLVGLTAWEMLHGTVGGQEGQWGIAGSQW